MLQNYDVDIRDFLSLTNAGLKVADFVQIKAAIIKRYKEAYGSDIDLSTASADGIFINNLALIMNNILKTISTIYSNLDVNSASGVYLDLLCRLSNIKRRVESYSSANILVQNIGSSSITLSPRLTFFDVNGVTWTSNNSDYITLSVNETKALTVICDEQGQIQAPAGSIRSAVDASLTISVSQPNSANVGLSDETDDELRERRAQSNGAQGITVLESLYGALRQLASIVDVKIYNNFTSADMTAIDGTVIRAHDIYVILRARENVILDNEEIGSLIYEKLTPGISTTEYNGEGGVAKSYEYTPTIIGSSVGLFLQNVYWKEAVAFNTSISFTIKKAAYFTDSTIDIIGKAMMKYFNTLPIGTTPSKFDVTLELVSADPQFKARPTFAVENISAIPQNLDTFYNYTSYSYSNGTEADTIVITLS